MAVFSIRPGTTEDHACIYATWLNSYRHGSNFPRRMPDKVFFAEHHDVIESILESSGVRIKVATPVDEPSVILGWCCVEEGSSDLELPPVVHYVYVKPPFRRYGIATALLHGCMPLGSQYSHETFVLRLPGLADKIKQACFNPYRAMRA